MGGKHLNYGKNLGSLCHIPLCYDTINFKTRYGETTSIFRQQVLYSESAMWLDLGQVFLQLTTILKLHTWRKKV
jgi:hypothetical protein